MSVRVMSLVWDKFPEGGSEMLVMLAMADWCNDEGLSLHPSNDAVAKKCRISRVQAQRVIRALTDGGWLEVLGNQFGGAPGTTKKYRLCVDKLKGYQNDTGITSDTGITHDTGITSVQRRVSPSAETGITGDTQTTIEPPIEPPINISSPAERFAEFWDFWPATDRRTQKAKCREKWKTHGLDSMADEIIGHVSALKKTNKWQSGFEPAPLTYLNGRQWEDGLPTVERQQQTAQPYETDKDRSRREVFDVLCGGKKNEPVANERDITGIAFVVD